MCTAPGVAVVAKGVTGLGLHWVVTMTMIPGFFPQDGTILPGSISMSYGGGGGGSVDSCCDVGLYFPKFLMNGHTECRNEGHCG